MDGCRQRAGQGFARVFACGIPQAEEGREGCAVAQLAAPETLPPPPDNTSELLLHSHKLKRSVY
jgi:hypothetical protein